MSFQSLAFFGFLAAALAVCLTAGRRSPRAGAAMLAAASAVFYLLGPGGWTVVLGGIVLCFADSLSGGGLAGDVLALLSGLTYAGVFLMNDMPDSDAISSVFWGDVISAVVGLPFVALETDFSLVPMVSLLVLGIFQVAVAYILLTVGLKTTPAVTASLVSGIEPVLNPILVAVFYGEKMGPMALIGAAIVIGGVIVYNVCRTKKQKPEEIQANELI